MSVLIANRISYSPVLFQPMKHSQHMNAWDLLPLRTMIITWMTPLIHIQMIHPHVNLVHHLIQFISLPLSVTILLLHHFTVPFPVGAFLHWMNNEYMLVTLHKMTSINNHVHIPDVFNGCGSQSRDVFFGGSKQYMIISSTWKEQLPNNALVITAISSSYQVSCYEQNREEGRDC